MFAARSVVLILLFCCIPLLVTAGVQEFRLDNGLKILIVEDHKVPLATFQVWYRVGSMDEPAGKSGMSHLLEHMMFKGTPKYGSKVFSNLIQQKGGTDNAQTSKDYTMYFQTMSSDWIGLSIELEADRMKHLLLDRKDFVAERSVVMEERRMRYDDDPQNLLYEELVKSAFMRHPYQRPVIGWMEEIAALQAEDLAAWYRANYSPGNAFLVISGDVTPDKILPLITKAFGAIPPAVDTVKRLDAQEPVQREPRAFTIRKETAELPYVLIAFHVPSVPHEDSYALEVLSTILSGGKSARLYKSLVYAQRLAIEAFADYSGINRDPFLFVLGASARPGTGIAPVEQALLAEVAKLRKEPPSERELQKAKNQTEAAFIFAQDSNHAQALYAGLFEVIGGWRLKDTYLDGIRKVTAADVQRVALKYLDREGSTTGFLIPKKDGAKAE
jgi:zinc protease